MSNMLWSEWLKLYKSRGKEVVLKELSNLSMFELRQLAKSVDAPSKRSREELLTSIAKRLTMLHILTHHYNR
jgi:hypothetical protein